jgi:type IX secretion system PorP/SprF family membrane protein
MVVLNYFTQTKFNILTVIVLFTILLGFRGNQAKAQGVYFSHYYNSPLVLNPAYTGQHENKYRLVSNTQVQGNYFNENVISGTISYDQQILIKKAQIGVGACYTFDRTLASSFPKQSIDISVASALQVSQRSGLGLGIQFGYNNMFLKYDHLSFPEQYNRGTGHFDNNLPISENFDTNHSNYLNVNAGLVWSLQMSHAHLGAGISVRHLNSPSYHLSEIEHSISPRYIYHVVYKNTGNDDYHFTPRVLYSHQNKASYMSFGSSVQINKDYGLESAKGYVFGVYYAFREELDASSVIGIIGFEKRMFTAMLSSEFNLNKELGNFNNRAIELTFIFRRPSLLLRKTIVPWVNH